MQLVQEQWIFFGESNQRVGQHPFFCCRYLLFFAENINYSLLFTDLQSTLLCSSQGVELSQEQRKFLVKIKNTEDITCFVVVRLCNKFKNAPILPGSCCVTHFVFSRRFRIFGTTNNAPQKLRQNMISHCLRQGWEQRQKQNVAFHAFWSQFISCI